MDLLLSWAAYPLVLGVLCLGCGLAVDALVASRTPGPLVPALGFAAIIVVGQFLTLADGTAGLTTPAVVILALAGLVLAAVTGRRVMPPPALLAAVAAVFAVYAAPIVLSGDATIAGFIKLDDTATWLAFTDQVMASGRDLSGLAPSTHEATLAINVGDGYPVGVFIPLGIGAQLLGTDPAWVIQPYMAFLAALFALAAWWLCSALVAGERARAAIAFVAAQPALLFGYYLWGGVKELAAAALIATASGLSAFATGRPDDPRALVGLAIVCAALIGVLSGGGAVWLAPVLLLSAGLLVRRLPARVLAVRAGAFAAGLAFLAFPVILPGGLLPPTSSPLDDADADGNLLGPLDPFQVAGIWPAGDFRLEPSHELLAYLLVALALALATVGAVWAWRRRATAVLLALAGAALGCLVLFVAGSPWVDGKALATASPFALLAAMLGAAAVAAETRPWLGIGAGILVTAAVLWSNVLAYRDVSLAPRDQLAELEDIGAAVAGEGPTLMTEYSPYGARHFLRDADPEAVSELRRRSTPRLDGEPVRKGYNTDTDLLQPDALGVYRTLVLRRSPAQSRPPSPYRLVWRGEFYEAWQRPPVAGELLARLPLGDRFDPVGRPRCEEVTRLARGARALVAARSASPVVVPLTRAAYPAEWEVARLPDTPVPNAAGTIAADVDVRTDGAYEVWLGGSARPAVELSVDGEPVGEVRHELNNLGGYVSFGTVELPAGQHRIELRFEGADLHPGSGGRGFPVGPIALSRSEAADSRLVRVPVADAGRLCGRQWDWIEARP